MLLDPQRSEICSKNPPIQYSVAMYGLVTTNPFPKPRVIYLAFTATVSFFHSTAVLERRKNPQNVSFYSFPMKTCNFVCKKLFHAMVSISKFWVSQRFNSYAMRFRNKKAKQMHQRDIKLYLDQLMDYDVRMPHNQCQLMHF